jgi:AcrR family transcriptional regulator
VPKQSSERRYGGLSAAERRAARRLRLLNAALELFGTAGFQKTTIPQLCSRAGVTTAHFYDEFPSREAVLTALYDQIANDVFGRVRAVLKAPEASMHERVRVANEVYFEYLTGDPRRARIYALEVVGISPEHERHRREQREAFVRQSAKAARRVETAGPVEGVDFRLLSVALAGASNALLVEWVLATPRPAVGAMVDQITTLWVRTLRLERSKKEDF